MTTKDLIDLCRTGTPEQVRAALEAGEDERDDRVAVYHVAWIMIR